MRYDDLRNDGIRYLEEVAGETWTDFNAHDPGITILEQLCYALTDLGYRIGFPIADLLAEGGADPYASLYPPAEILSTRPVTAEDLRRLVLDVDGVKNVWIEPQRSAFGADSDLYYDPEMRTLAFEDTGRLGKGVRLEGLYRVLIEKSDHPGFSNAGVRRAVAQRLHANRGLGEDFAEIRVLEQQGVQVAARIEISTVDDIEGLLLEIFTSLAAVISPPVTFLGLEELLATGRAVEEIFEGPLLRHGFLTGDGLAAGSTARPTAVHTSDLIHALMDIDGVRAVKQIRVASGGDSEPWNLQLDPQRVPILDFEGSDIVFEKDGIVVQLDRSRAFAAYREQLRPEPAVVAPGGETSDDGALAPPQGRDRRVGDYASVCNQFPAVYGIGPLGLPASASPRRRALAKQLKAYLLFFDQLLADELAQLAHVKDLFSFASDDLRTYFSQNVRGPGLGLGEIHTHKKTKHLARLEELADGSATSLERKNRFLSHLLARFGEELVDYAIAIPKTASGSTDGGSTDDGPLARLARSKQSFLQHYPQISSARGTATDVLRRDSVSGLAERLRLLLAPVADLDGAIILVEHILLRPIAPDRKHALFLERVPHRDPFSLQLSLVLPDTLSPHRELIRQTARRETPAHLTLFVHWLAPNDWSYFQEEMRSWLELRQEYRTAELRLGETITEGEHASLRTELQVVRNRLLELLALGRPPFLIGLEVEVERWIIPYRTSATILVPDSQPGVEYTLYRRYLNDDDFVYEVNGQPQDAQGRTVRERDLLRVPVPDEPDVMVLRPTAFDNLTAVSSKGGHGGTLRWTVDDLKDDTLFYVKAQKADDPDDIEHTQRLRTAVVLVEADAEVDLAVTIVGEGEERRFLVEQGQPGVWYQFRKQDGTALGPPLADKAYINKRQGGASPGSEMNRGLDLLRLELDLFLSRGYKTTGKGYAEDPPLPPLLDVGAVEPGETLQVRAVKARTRVGTFLRYPAAGDPGTGQPNFATPPAFALRDPEVELGGGTKIDFTSRVGERYALFQGDALVQRAPGEVMVKDGTGGDLHLGTGELTALGPITFEVHVMSTEQEPQQPYFLRWIVPLTVQVVETPPTGGAA